MVAEAIVRGGLAVQAHYGGTGSGMTRTKVTRRKSLTVLSGARPAQHPDRPRPWKSTDAAAAAKEFLAFLGEARARRAAMRALMEQLSGDDPYEHRCAAEVARLVSQRQPGILAGYSDLLADAAAAFPEEEWQARGYVIVAAALNAGTHAQKMRLAPIIRERLRDEERTGVRAMALEALLVLGARDASMRDEALDALEAAQRSPSPAMRARARRMMMMTRAGNAPREV
jgi:hypothetical protein